MPQTLWKLQEYTHFFFRVEKWWHLTILFAACIAFILKYIIYFYKQCAIHLKGKAVFRRNNQSYQSNNRLQKFLVQPEPKLITKQSRKLHFLSLLSNKSALGRSIFKYKNVSILRRFYQWYHHFYTASDRILS